MSTNVSVKSETAESAEVKSELSTLLADTTVVSDKTFIRLMGAVDTHQLKVGGKWYDLIVHCKGSLLVHAQKDFKDLNPAEKEELKAGKAIILKSLGEMGKTESSAQSIRSYIVKMVRPDMQETLDKLKAGEITVRASREAGRKPQSNPSQARSDATRYADAVDTVVRYAIAQQFDSAKVYADIGSKFAEYEARKAEKPDAEKAAKDKAEMQEAIKQTEAQLANKS